MDVSSSVGKEYRLRRMLLINAGTNKHVASNRITSIDPRGGAAVLGANGVGKTTTLRLLPLFFGHQASRLVAEGDGQAGMVRFILPEESSAIAYEYQRGGEDDLRLAVMRRAADDPNVPSYRIFRGGWSQELFVDDGLFLTDVETVERASTLGIAHTRKLTSSEYRAVILRSAVVSKDKHLRSYRLEHSFGPSSLDNLDRLVAAMLKDKVNFTDIIQVAISRVQQNIGQTEQGKLSFKQRKAQIEEWLSLRKACLEALGLAPRIVGLRQSIERHAIAENALRACWWDVSQLLELKTEAGNKAGRDIECLESERKTQLQNEEQKRKEFQDALTTVTRESNEARNISEALLSRWRHFQENDADGWRKRLVDESALRADLGRLNAQIQAANDAHADANKRYDSLAQVASAESGAVVEALRESKDQPRAEYDEALVRIDGLQKLAVSEEEESFAAVQSELDGRKDELISSRAVWSQRAEFPHPSDEAVQAVAKANQDLLDHSGRCVEAQKETSSASAVLQTAQQSFERQEEVVRAAHASVSDAQSNVEQAQALLAPSTRSLLHALRSHPDDSWKEHLAKVVHPDLLQREDLAPLMVGVEDASFYGWLIQTDAISMPDWADDSRLREALDSAQTLLGSAQAHLGLATEDLRTKSEDRLRAEDAAAQAVAALAVLESKLDGLSAAKDRAELALSKEKATLRDDAQAQVNKYAGQLGELTSQIASARSESSARLSSINSAHEKMRADALHVRNGALAQIDKAITGEQSKLRAHLESLEAQRLAHLGNHGVDVQKLQSLNDEANGISSQLLQIENHKPLVQAWRQFLEEGGEPVVQAAQRRAQDLLSKVGIQRQALADHESVMGASLESYRALSQRLGAQYQAIQDDLHGLQVLLQSFPSRPAHVPSTVTLDISVAQLKGRVSELRDAQEQAASVIRDECVHVRSRLTSSNKQLAQFVREWMGQYAAEEDSIVLQASALCQCHDRIGYEIVRPNNVELKTIFYQHRYLEQCHPYV